MLIFSFAGCEKGENESISLKDYDCYENWEYYDSDSINGSWEKFFFNGDKLVKIERSSGHINSYKYDSRGNEIESVYDDLKSVKEYNNDNKVISLYEYTNDILDKYYHYFMRIL